MSAYWIGRARVREPAIFQQYAAQVSAIAHKFPYEVLARGGQSVTLEGAEAFNRFVLLRFASMRQAIEYYNSPEYQAAVAIRRQGGDAEIVITQGP